MRGQHRFEIRFTWTLGLLLALLFISQPLQSQISADRDGKFSVRHRDTPAGLYESSYGNALRGTKVSDLDLNAIRTYLTQHPRLQFENQAYDLATGQQLESAPSASHDRRILYVVGVPLFGKDRREVLNLVKELTNDRDKHLWQRFKDFWFFDKDATQTHVRPISRPGGRWKIVQNFMHPMISPSDMAPTPRSAVWEGAQSVMISAGAGITVQLIVQIGEHTGEISKAMAIVIPAWIVNTLQSAWTSLPRTWWSNYFRRAEGIAAPFIEPVFGRNARTEKISRVLGSISQQIWMTLLFQANVYTAGQGSWERSKELLNLGGFFTIVREKLNSIVSNIWWRTPVENSLADFIEKDSSLRNSQVVQTEAAKIRKVLTIIATNLWVYSTITGVNWEYAGYKWNVGHLGMGMIGLAMMGYWIKPEMFRVFTKSGRAYQRGCAGTVQSLSQK